MGTNDGGHADSGRADSSRADSSHADSSHADSGRADSSHADFVALCARAARELASARELGSVADARDAVARAMLAAMRATRCLEPAARAAAPPAGPPPAKTSRLPVKHSAGLIIVRETAAGHEVALVRGRCSYALAEFVVGRYTAASAPQLLARMSADELADLADGFGVAWRRVWGSLQQPKPGVFEHFFSKFRANWPRGRLRRVIAGCSPCGDARWEFPKGRRQRHEDLRATALRETAEEARLPAEALRLVPGWRRTVGHEDSRVRYVADYFLALLARPAAIRPPHLIDRLGIRFDSGQFPEIVDVRWARLDEARVLFRDLVQGGELYKAARGAVNFVRRRRLFAGLAADADSDSQLGAGLDLDADAAADADANADLLDVEHENC